MDFGGLFSTIVPAGGTKSVRNIFHPHQDRAVVILLMFHTRGSDSYYVAKNSRSLNSYRPDLRDFRGALSLPHVETEELLLKCWKSRGHGTGVVRARHRGCVFLFQKSAPSIDSALNPCRPKKALTSRCVWQLAQP